MPNAIVVLNAGSSSIKFSLFVERGENLELGREAGQREIELVVVAAASLRCADRQVAGPRSERGSQ